MINEYEDALNRALEQATKAEDVENVSAVTETESESTWKAAPAATETVEPKSIIEELSAPEVHVAEEKAPEPNAEEQRETPKAWGSSEDASGTKTQMSWTGASRDAAQPSEQTTSGWDSSKYSASGSSTQSGWDSSKYSASGSSTQSGWDSSKYSATGSSTPPSWNSSRSSSTGSTPQTNWGSPQVSNTPHYDYYRRQQQARQAQQMARQRAQATRQPMAAQPTTKKKGRWPALIASALIFGLIAGSVMVGINQIGNRLFPSTQSASVVPTPQPTTLSLATTGSDKEEATVASSSATSNTGTKTVAMVAEEAMPSLVTIATVSVQEMQSFFGVQQYEAEGAGTGVIVGENDTELLIATNEHVISGASQVSIGFIDEEVVSAQVKGEDAQTDLAIVAVKKEDIPESTMSKIKIAVIGNSDELVLGEQVVAIGNALGVGQSVTSGYVSALGRELDLSDGYTQFVSSDLIQTDAAINSGNSGGALLNMKGELIGINEAKSAYTSAGVPVDNAGYAIPMSKAQPILEDLMNQTTREIFSEEEQGYLGVSLANISSDMSQMYSMPEGVCFTEVAEGSPAAKAGAQKGDVLIELDGRVIRDSDALMKEMQYHRSGDTIEMKILRAHNGQYQEQTLQVTLGTRDVLESLEQSQD